MSTQLLNLDEGEVSVVKEPSDVQVGMAALTAFAFRGLHSPGR